jgi:hypothetical protein
MSNVIRTPTVILPFSALDDWPRPLCGADFLLQAPTDVIPQLSIDRIQLSFELVASLLIKRAVLLRPKCIPWLNGAPRPETPSASRCSLYRSSSPLTPAKACRGGIKDAGVLRLGRSNAPGTGAGTAFALVQLGDALADLFLSDDALAAAVLLRHFCPTSPAWDLYPFHLLPQLSERNVLSYAFASGMLAEACPL